MGKTTREDLERARGQWSEEFKRLNPGLTTPQNRPAPLTGAPCSLPEAENGPTQPKSPLAAIFEEKWAALGGPTLITEHRFHEKRRWRFDYALPEFKIAIELEGGVHARKGHASPEGYIKDCEKYNHATADGWLIFRLASGMMQDERISHVASSIYRIILERQSDF